MYLLLEGQARPGSIARPRARPPESWGLSVDAYNGRAGAALGKYRHRAGIALGVENLATWAHELCHAADDRLGALKERGQHWRSETVAELGGATLLEALFDAVGSYADCDPETGECWQYMGAVDRDRPAVGSTLPLTVTVHQFRHRHRPQTARPIKGFAGDTRGKRVYLEIAASAKYAPHNGPLADQPMDCRALAYDDDPVTQ